MQQLVVATETVLNCSGFMLCVLNKRGNSIDSKHQKKTVSATINCTVYDTLFFRNPRSLLRVIMNHA